MISELVYSLLVAVLTVLVGLPFARSQIKLPSKLVFSYAIGFTLISVAGLSGNLLGVNLFAAQATVLLISSIYLALTRKKHEIKYDKDDLPAIAIMVFYIIFCLFLLRNTLAWMGGDEIGHAATVREFLDGEKVPLSIYPFGSKIDYYPKAFHVYTSFWIKVLPGFGLLTALKVIPIIFSAFSALALYALLKELGGVEGAIYSMIFFLMLSIHHFGYLIWAGYPSIAAEMLMLTLLLTLVGCRWMVLSLLVGIALTHTRFLVYAAGVFGSWILLEAIVRKRKWLPTIVVVVVIALAVGLHLGILNTKVVKPAFMIETLKDSQYLLMWAPYVIAIPGTIFALKRRSKLDTLALSIILSAVILSFSTEVGIIKLPIMPDRALNQAYIGLSALSGITLFWIQKKIGLPKISKTFPLLLIVAGIIMITFVFNQYATPWSLPKSDYDAIQWINSAKYENSFAVTIDSVGGWMYPLTGVKVYDPWSSQMYYIENGPSSEGSMATLKNIKSEHDHLLIYLSSLSTKEKLFESPFRRSSDKFRLADPKAFTPEHFNLLYSKDGVYIFEFVPSGNISLR